jgi:hypothetical protein
MTWSILITFPVQLNILKIPNMEKDDFYPAVQSREKELKTY